MKMKKLTALALAGVLCMGMSTVALAAPSVGPEDAYSATDEAGNTVNLQLGTVVDDGVKVESGNFRYTQYKGWDSADPKKASDAIKQTFKEAAGRYEEEIAKLEGDNRDYAVGKLAEYKKQQDALAELVNSDALIEVADLVDIEAPDYNVDKNNPLTVKFVLNDRLADLKVGQDIRVMHYNEFTGLWEVYEGSVEYDTKSSKFFVTCPFTSLSPVAVLRVTSDGSVEDVTPPTNNPADTNEPTVTPNENGQITADQLAELIAQRLQANGVKFERTAANGKASPKTGE